jgi:hypothetical protein
MTAPTKEHARLSRPHQDREAPASRLVAAIEAVWAEIRRRHPDVPEVIVTVGAGSIGTPRGTLRLGHYAAARWHPTPAAPPAADDPRAPHAVAELFIGGEGLARGSVDVLGTLLHEAAHGIATTRGVKDTSRAGAYHNARYKHLAEELGLQIDRDPTIGWSLTTVPPATVVAYQNEIAHLRDAIAHIRESEHRARRPDPGTPTGGDADPGTNPDKTGGRSAPTYTCTCTPPRRMRMAPTVHALAAVTCNACGEPFTTRD